MMGRKDGAGTEQETRGVSEPEAVRLLLEKVAQLTADNTDLRNKLREKEDRVSQVGLSSQGVDPAAAGLIIPFSGKVSEDVVSFLEDLSTAAEMGGWSDAQLLQVAKLRLSGEAKTFVRCTEALRNAVTFRELEQGLLQRYKKQNSARFFREKLASLVKKSNESMEEFADRIRRVNVNTYELGNSDEANRVLLQEAEQRALDAFLRGIPAEMSRRVRSGAPADLHAALRLATEYEEIDLATGVQNKRSIFSTEVRCFSCGRTGHVQKFCRQRRGNDGNQQQTGCRNFGNKRGGPQRKLNGRGGSQSAVRRFQ